jgi:hypothetical protein
MSSPLETRVLSDTPYPSSFMESVDDRENTLASSGEDGAPCPPGKNCNPSNHQSHAVRKHERIESEDGLGEIHSKRVYFSVFSTRIECNFSRLPLLDFVHAVNPQPPSSP